MNYFYNKLLLKNVKFELATKRQKKGIKMADKKNTGIIRHVPNTLTIGRFILTIIFLVMILYTPKLENPKPSGFLLIAFILFVVTGLTDLADEAEPFVNYRRPIEPGDMLRRLCDSKHLDIVRPKKFQAGNMILIKFDKDPQHVALITTSRPYTSVIHACGRVGKVLEQNIPPEWLVSAEFRFVGLSDS